VSTDLRHLLHPRNLRRATWRANRAIRGSQLGEQIEKNSFFLFLIIHVGDMESPH
jgi:hypothetical protein